MLAHRQDTYPSDNCQAQLLRYNRSTSLFWIPVVVIVGVTVDITLDTGRMPIHLTDRVCGFSVDFRWLYVVPTLGADTAFGG